MVVFTSVKPLSRGRDLRIDDKLCPGNWRESKSIERFRIVGLVEWIVDVHIEEGFQFHPADRKIIPARLQTVANSDTPDRPAIDGIDRWCIGESRAD